MLRSILAGGMAGCMTMSIVYPLDFARTLLAVDMGKGLADRKYQGIFNCVS